MVWLEELEDEAVLSEVEVVVLWLVDADDEELAEVDVDVVLLDVVLNSNVSKVFQRPRVIKWDHSRQTARA